MAVNDRDTAGVNKALEISNQSLVISTSAGKLNTGEVMLPAFTQQGKVSTITRIQQPDNRLKS